MSYHVLARKWRPRSFQEMVGQEHILRMLTNALDHQRLHHAYLFTGTRGVGKTTLARIFAKCLNCETGITSQPCGQCKTCQAIDAGKFLDLIEVDAASRTKVEDTRELLDNVQYTPSQGRFKIYLIDEVHMLSGHSFNALLKTLEEPPSYIKFLLATTDPKRLPITVLSRCLQFNLKRVPVEKITQQLSHICTEENTQFELPALESLAQAADGSMRDALSLLDQTIAFCHNNITEHDTRQMLGNTKQESIYQLLDSLSKQNGKELFDVINALAEHTPDFSQVLEDLASALHQISMAQVLTEMAPNEAIKRLATALTAEEAQLYYQIALIGRRDLPLAPTPQQGFEMAMLRMLAFSPVTQTPAHTDKVIAAPNNRASAPPKIVAAPSAQKQKETSTPTAGTNKQPTPAKTISNDWAEILPHLGLSGMAQALGANCTLTRLEAERIELALAKNHEPMLNEKLISRMEQALSQYFNKTIQLKINITDNDIYTPAKQQQQHVKTQHANATESIKNDTQVKKIIEAFDATLDVASIQAIDPA